ncbi:MAG: alpha/beta hydrolase fold domain-containing protein [Planctomycetaceae bacterium]
MTFTPRGAWALSITLLFAGFAHLLPADERPYTRQQDLIYGRKVGTALTLDAFTPTENANGAGIVLVISAGWHSSHELIDSKLFAEYFGFVNSFTRRGYTVFAVVHGTHPNFTINEMVPDIRRAVRFVRSRAADFKIDPNRIGISGASAGGHLSLMLGTTSDEGNADASDPVDRESCRVKAIACFFPPTDFLNYGSPGENGLGAGRLKDIRSAFDFRAIDSETKSYAIITDEETRQRIGREISPAYHVSPDDPPALIIHGDADLLVPFQQAELMVAKFKECDVPVELVVRPGAVHGWAGLDKDVLLLADWFDKYLAGK